MPNNYTQKELKDRFEKLPEVLKDAMFSTDIAAKILEIGKKHGLNIEKTGFMAEEAGYFILGLTRPAELASVLTEALEVKEDRAKDIANDLSHRVFYPLREALKDAHQIEVGEAALQKNDIILKKPQQPVSSLPGQKTKEGPPLPTSANPATPLPTTPVPPTPPPTPLSANIIPVSPPTSSQPTTPPPLPSKPNIIIPLPPKPAELQTQTSPAQLSPKPKPEEIPLLPPKPLSPSTIISVPPPISLKPPAEKPPMPPIAPPIVKPTTEQKPAPALLPQAPAKIEPIDLRLQQKIKLPDLPPPKPESMGGSIFGAPAIVNLSPKPPAPPSPPPEKTTLPKPWSGRDPYREPIE